MRMAIANKVRFAATVICSVVSSQHVVGILPFKCFCTSVTAFILCRKAHYSIRVVYYAPPP